MRIPIERRPRFVAAVLLATALVALTATPAPALTSAPDPTWRTKPQDKSYALARSGNTIFVGGQLSNVYDASGQFVRTASALIAVDASTGTVLPWDAQIVKSSGAAQVNALAVSADGSTLYVGGRFTSVGGEAHKNLAAVDVATGAVVSSFDPTVSSAVKAILVGPSRIYLGGEFKKIDNQTRNYLAAVGFDGALDPTWTPSASDDGSGVGVSIHSLEFAADGATVFVGGRFRSINSTSRMAVARVASDTGAVAAWAIPPGTIDTGNQAWDLLVTPTRLFGGFGNGPNYVSAFRLDNGNTGSQTWRINTVGNVQGLSLHPNGTQMFVAGHFGTGGLQQTVCNGQNLRGLMLVAMADAAPPGGRIDCSWLPQITPFGRNFHGAWPLLTYGSQLWAGLKSKTVSGVTASGFARWTI